MLHSEIVLEVGFDTKLAELIAKPNQLVHPLAHVFLRDLAACDVFDLSAVACHDMQYCRKLLLHGSTVKRPRTDLDVVFAVFPDRAVDGKVI